MKEKQSRASKQGKQSEAIKQSATTDIMRSQITLNPFNPKIHTSEQVKQQVANIKANGYLGGIVWNERSGNLVDGHRRLQALDSIHKYDGSPEKDYAVKVEVVDFDSKTEKEQMTYMAVGNSKADYNIIATYADQIDTANIGLSQEDYEKLQSLVACYDAMMPQMQDLGTDFLGSPTYDLSDREQTFDDIARQREGMSHASREEIQAKKQASNNVVASRNAANRCHIMLDFSNEDDLQTFCEATGLLMSENMLVDGMEFLDKLGL